MRVLAIFAHPRRESFTGALLDRFLGGLREAGHAATVADLYREGFAADLQAADLGQFRGEPMPADVRREQARIDAADALALVFPVYWWSFPSILKGWIDRVFSQGWAYDFTPERSIGLLADRPVQLLASAGSTWRTYRKYGYHGAMQRQIDIGVFGYCGLDDVRMEIFYDVNEDPSVLQSHLTRAEALGRDLATRKQSPSLSA
ncbi:MAG TPA: NAD(P)H-dependent oxidoreductase [Methylomirabilota bacterium]|nr:NAD(P)H-dependent oxidoreductase [Methylomirabilota bacterium]